MIPYQPGPGDGMLVRWWSEIAADGSIYSLFGPQGRTLSSVMATFQDAPLVWDSEKAQSAIWFEPFMSGALVSLWVRRTARRYPSVLRFIKTSHERALGIWSSVMAITTQPSVVRQAKRFGYREVGRLDKLAWGQNATLLQLTKESYID